MIPTRSARRVLAIALGGMILAAVLPAAHGQLPQPRLTSLARAGMRAGETVEVTLRGTDLEGVTRLWFDHPGIRAAHFKDLTFRVAGPEPARSRRSLLVICPAVRQT
jgi:hypothetical protein